MSQDDRIAIIGIGCRFPGADNIDEFWKVLLHGENHVVDIPKERWDVDAIYDADPDAPGKTYVRKAGLIPRHDTWDNNFFGISDIEAEQIDPQQRLVLDCVQMTMENAGIRKTDISGSLTGVYIGTMNDDYMFALNDDLDEVNNYSVTGSARSIISARVSYTYNLLGPSMTIDTACSSALVAIHTGIQAIKLGDCNMALCGGVNSILYPELFITLSKARMLSPTGQCQAFSAKADGYARGEGCGIILLKKLSEAQKDGDYIWGTITTGCNQDGHESSPITAPSLVQQKRLLEKVYKENGVDPCSVQYIEAHGTGTPVGDPIEVDSLGTFFSEHRAQQTEIKNIMIGSVKSNIGHTESAAGVAGIIKILLMMKNSLIVPSLHSEELNPKIPFDQYKFCVAQNNTVWEKDPSERRIACVNCFGFGGTNSHAIIEQVKNPYDTKLHTSLENLENIESRPYLIAISAADSWSLEQLVRDYVIFLSTYEGSIENLSYTLLCKKDHYKYRFAITSDSISQVREQIKHTDFQSFNTSQTSSSRRIIFVCSGVGTTWSGMCKSLIDKVPVFRHAIEEIDEYLQNKTEWSLMQILNNFEENMDPFVSHICIFGCQIGLYRLWRHWGINPDAVIGQSVGEVAAAHIAGYLSLKEAITVIYERSRLLRKADGGKMTVVRNVETTVVEEMLQKTNGVSIAVYNSSESCTISGDPDLMQKIERDLVSKNRAVIRRLNVQCAYHSQYVQTSSEELEDALKHITVNDATIPVYSTVTGDIAENNFATAKYWKQNVREPVLFSKAVEKSISEKSMNIFVEIGPKAVLEVHAETILKNKKFCVLPSMKPFSEEFRTLLSSLQDMYQHGVNPNWINLFDTSNITAITQTPCYRFNRKPIFFETKTRQRKSRGPVIHTSGHLFFSSQDSDKHQYQASLDSRNTKFVYDHTVQDVITVPGAIYCEIAFAISIETFKCLVEDVQVHFEILNPVFIQKRRSCDLYCSIQSVDVDNLKFEVTKDNLGKTKVAIGNVKKCRRRSYKTINLKRLSENCTYEIPTDDFYDILSNMGFSYGETLRNFTCIKFNSEEVVAEIKVSGAIISELQRTYLHPAVLDGVLQSFAPLISKLTKTKDFRIFPSAIKSVNLHQTIEETMTCYTRLVEVQTDSLVTNAVLVCNKGNIIAEFQNIRYTLVDANDDKPESFEYEIRWQKEKTLPEVLPFEKRKLVCLMNDKGVKEKLVHLFEGFQTKFFNLCKTKGKISNKVFERLSSIHDISCILYYPGYRCCRDDQNLQIEVYDAVKLSCFGLLKLVQSVKKMNKDIPIIIVTEDTQTTPGFHNESVNLIGSELWGMGRSVTVEPYATRLYLLDINTETPLLGETLRSIVFGVIGDSLIHAQEILVRNNQIYTNSLQRLENPISSIDFRTNFVDDSCSVCLKSSDIATITSPFFTIQKEITGGKNYHDSVFLEVENIFLHPSIFYPLTETGLHGIKTLLFGKNTDGHQILALELIGEIEIKTTQAKNGCIFHKSTVFPKYERRKVAALYPSKVMSSIIVPTSCVINLEDFPGYHNGTLQALFLAWNMTSPIDRKQDVIVIYDHNLPNIYVFMLKAILQIRNKCTVEIRRIEDVSVYDQNRDVCVVFGDISSISPDRLKRKMQLIVSLNIFISHEYMNELREHDQCAIAEIYDFETIFDPVHIKKNFPVVKSWLLENWKHPILQSLNKMISSDEENVVYLKSHTSSGRLSNCYVRVQKDELFRRNACYVVTGGLTGLGWEIVKLLCIKGAGYVVTLSRSNPSQAIRQQIENIQSICGNKIHTIQADVCDYTQLDAAFKHILEMFPNIPVKGIFHGAGILDTASYMNMTSEKIENVLRPKVLGTLNLHIISRKFILDYFVMHSSIASILGDINQTNYAAANSFLDGMAHFRRFHGLPGQSINWGALDVGMAKNITARTVLFDRGFKILDVENIKYCFILSLFRNNVQITYSNFDWSRLSENLLFDTHSSLKYRTQNFLKKKTTKIDKMSNAMGYETFYITDEEKYKRIKEIVQNTTSEVLKIDKEDILDNLSLMDLGMDSQKGIEFCRILEQKTGCNVPLVYAISNEFVLVGIVQYIFENLSEDSNKNKSESRQMIRSMTHAENAVYRTVTNESGCSMFIHLEFKISKKFSAPILRRVLQWLISVYPELRTIYRNCESVRFSVLKTVLPYTDTIIDLRTIDEPIEDETYLEYDPSKDLPIKAVFFHKKKEPFLKIMINSIASDIKSCVTICKLVHTALVSFCKQRELPTMELPDQIDYAVMYEEFLESERQDLIDFWKEYLSGSLNYASFNKKKKERQREQTKRYYISKRLTESMYCRLQKYLEESNLTVLQICICLYQCILNSSFECEPIAIRAKVYAEKYPNEFQGRIWQSSNFIPIVLKLFPENSLSSFIKINSENIQRCVEKSAYPFDLILSDNRIDPDAFCHEIRVVDISAFDEISDTKDFFMNLHAVKIDYDPTECSLMVLQNDFQKELEFRFSFDSESKGAEKLVDDLYKLLEICLDKPETDIREIQLETPKLNCLDKAAEKAKENADYEVTKL